MDFYVDSCIYLNLWQEEESPTGKQLWKLALDFFDAVERENLMICVSGFVLKELSYVLSAEVFRKKAGLFQDSSRFRKIVASRDDYEQARKLESASKFDISFFDCMHIVLSMKASATLVTRDRKLLDFSRKYCRAVLPEEALTMH